MKSYTPTIGIEVHAELKTNTKMFCDSKNDPHAGEANTHVCPVCMAHPGTLPTINKEAVKHVLKVGLGLGSELATYTEFDRKNYFYPDIPKGYQISQYEYPLVKGGELAGVKITRVHLEEDTARSLHDQGSGSLVDYNRAGVPLMELVTEPVIHDVETAGKFVRELQLLLRTLGASDANMEKGEMRVEANISVSDTDTFGTKVEVKNLNSFKSFEGAIRYEIDRQIKVIERGEKVVQETRGWDEQKGKTYSQRLKESADEYRYFPDPDLPSLDLSTIPEFSLSRLKEEMPEIPEEKRKKYDNLGITREQIELIISDRIIVGFFESCLAHVGDNKDLIKTTANYLTSDVLALLDKDGVALEVDKAPQFVALMQMVVAGQVTSRVAKDMLSEVVFEGIDPIKTAEERGLMQNNSEDAILEIVQAILKEHASVAEEYKNGKDASLQFLVGQGMKATKGSANPALLAELLKKEIMK